jgi:hypothetical protein
MLLLAFFYSARGRMPTPVDQSELFPHPPTILAGSAFCGALSAFVNGCTVITPTFEFLPRQGGGALEKGIFR